MHIKILALDLDGTLAEHDAVHKKTLKALYRAKDAGMVLILVTGRQLEPLPGIGPFDELCEAIVAEDGAVVYFPASDSILLPFGQLAPEVVTQLDELGIPLEKGMAIAATNVPHDQKVMKVLSDTGYPATIEYNKGAVMVMPPGATKGTGLLMALRELGYSIRNVLACGDGENDRSMLEQAELAVAVANATPAIRDLADAVLPYSNGKGVQYLIRQLLLGEIPAHESKPMRRLELGRYDSGLPVNLSPSIFLDGNLIISGRSGSGKSWLAGLIVEGLLKLNYQIWIVDPEGDYRSLRSFPHTLLLGGDRLPPPVADVITISEYTDISIILDLSLLGRHALRQYVIDLMRGLSSLRARRGQPHWFLFDEAHYFCPSNGGGVTDLLLENMKQGGIGLISYRPSLISPEVLDMVDHWMLTQIRDPEELNCIEQHLGDQHDLSILPTMPRKQAYLSLGKVAQIDVPESGVIEFDALRRIVPHVRHLHKYLMAPLPASRMFYFHISEPYDGPITAASLWEFKQIIPKLPFKTIERHLKNKDFERWLREVLHDKELARRIRKLSRRNLKRQPLREALARTVADRFEELERLV